MASLKAFFFLTKRKYLLSYQILRWQNCFISKSIYKNIKEDERRNNSKFREGDWDRIVLKSKNSIDFLPEPVYEFNFEHFEQKKKNGKKKQENIDDHTCGAITKTKKRKETPHFQLKRA